MRIVKHRIDKPNDFELSGRKRWQKFAKQDNNSNKYNY